MSIYLIFDGNIDLLAAQIKRIQYQGTSELNIVVSDIQQQNSPELMMRIALSFRYFFWQHGAYSTPGFKVSCNFFDFEDILKLPIAKQDKIFICPEQSKVNLTQTGLDIELSLSKEADELLYRLSKKNVILNEKELTEFLDISSPSKLINRSDIHHLLQTWVTEMAEILPLKQPDENIFLNNYHFFWELQLHRSDWFELLSKQLHQIEKSVTQHPKCPYLNLMLSIFRRQHINLESHILQWPSEQMAVAAQKFKAHRHLFLMEPPHSNSVAIFMPTFNRLESLKQAVESVYQQTYKNWDLYIWDNASTDKTESYCINLCNQDSRIHYYKNEFNYGYFGVINYSFQIFLEINKSDYISILADDDRWYPEHLEQVMAVFKESPWLAKVHSNYYLIQDYKNILGKYGPFKVNQGKLHPQNELDNAIQMDLCPVGDILRKDAVKNIYKLDISEGCIYPPQKSAWKNLLWDYMLHVKILAYYEVGTSNANTVLFNVSPNTGIHTWDATWELLCLLDQVQQDYYALFDEELPQSTSFGFLNRRQEKMVKQFSRQLQSASTENWEQFVAENQTMWKYLVALKERKLQNQ